MITYQTKAIADNTLCSNDDLIETLLKNGWTSEDLTKNTHKGTIDLGFKAFHRTIKNPMVFPHSHERGKSHQYRENPESVKIQSIFDTNAGGQDTLMPVTGVRSALDNEGGGGFGCEGAFHSINSLMKMRSIVDSFVISMGSSYMFTEDMRHIIGWHFCFILPNEQSDIVELLVVSKKDHLISLVDVLGFIISRWDIAGSFGIKNPNGISMYKQRRWNVPVRDSRGNIRTKTLDNFKVALESCVDDEVRDALSVAGVDHKCTYVSRFDESGRCVNEAIECVNGYGIGYVIDNHDLYRASIPVSLVCHAGASDLTTLRVESINDDLMKYLAEVNGGLVTQKECRVLCFNPLKYWNAYPIRLSVRDTMCFTPQKEKQLASIGKTIGVNRIELDSGFKDDLISLLKDNVITFM